MREWKFKNHAVLTLGDMRMFEQMKTTGVSPNLLWDLMKRWIDPTPSDAELSAVGIDEVMALIPQLTVHVREVSERTARLMSTAALFTNADAKKPPSPPAEDEAEEGET